MAAVVEKLMTTEEFVARAEARTEKHWELFDGAPQIQQSQNWGHARHILKIYRLIDDEIARRGLSLSIATKTRRQSRAADGIRTGYRGVCWTDGRS
jgi:hypothetical protein